MGNSRSRAGELSQTQVDEVSARELGLKNNLKLAEVNMLIDYYKRKDPDNLGLLPEQFKKAAGEFFADGLTIDPKIIFSIFDTAEGGVAGRVTLREFILGYAILCRGSTEGRLRYLFAIYGNVEGDGLLTRGQLINSLRLMRRIVTALTDPDESEDEKLLEKQIETAADEVIQGSSDPEKHGVSYDEFIEQVKKVDVITEWLEDLSSVAGEHMKYLEKRELAIVQLHMEREGLLASASQASRSLRSGSEWSKDGESGQIESSKPAAEQKIKIPLPKKYKPVRRDLSIERTSSQKEGAPSAQVPDEDETGLSAEVYAAKPFVINYSQIDFGKILGRGACATVYECRWLHVPVAVKVFNDGYGEAAGIDKLATDHEEQRKMVVGDYVEEFWLLLQIRHPNCLLYMGICFEPYVCIVTELFTGGSVTDFLHGPNPRKFTPEQALEMLSGVARGMYYLHASTPSILHRDLKASNILINRTVTHCVICDFGLSGQFVAEASGARNSSRGAKQEPQVIGTPYTMAPEVMNGEPYTPAADVYSYGIIMYEMYTGRFPFPNKKPVQLWYHVLTEQGRPKFYDEDDVPPTLKSLIEQCWAHDQNARPSFEEILRVLASEKLKQEISERHAIEMDMEGGESTREEERKSSLSTRLLEAVYRGNAEKASRLIEQGAQVNYEDYDKRTALHVAAAEGHVNCIRLLVGAGAQLSFDRWGNSPIADAANYANRTGDSEPIRVLRGVESRLSSSKLGEQTIDLDAHHINMLHKQIALTAAAEGDLVTLKKILDTGLDVDCSDYDRRTPLMVAASEGHRDIVELLIQRGAEVDLRDRWASTAYHEAQRGGFHDVIRLIRQAGGGSESASATTRYWST